MQAVVLAAGYGRRMRPLSDRCHKALLPVGGTTVLGRIIDALKAVDIRDVLVVTGYRAEDVEQFVAEHAPDVNFRFVDNPRFDQTNNIVSLSLALNALPLDDDIVLLECDLLFDPDLLRKILAHPSPNVALVDRYRTGMDGTVVTMRDGIITEVIPPKHQTGEFVYNDKFKTLNIYRFSKEFIKKTLRPIIDTYAKDIDPMSYYELVLTMLSNIPEHRIAAEIVDGESWTEIDDPNDLAVARFQFEPEGRAEVLDASFGGQWNLNVLDFAFMRNSYFPTDSMIAAMRHALPALVSSYGSAQPILNEKMSYFLACEGSQVQVLNGASQLYPILARMFAGKTVAIPDPTFGEYSRSFPQAIRYGDDSTVDWTALSGRVDLAVVVNPNTPTGTLHSSTEIFEFARSHPHTTVLVDESFLAFSDEISVRELLRRDPLDNVMVLTSLSKMLGCPGVRLGYLFSCNASLLESIGADIPIWNLSSMAEFMMELLLKYSQELEMSLVQTAKDREALRTALGALALVHDVAPSGGNFLLTELVPGVDAASVRRLLLAEHHIDVKDVTLKFSDGSPRLRLAVRLPEENQLLLDALAAITPGVVKA